MYVTPDCCILCRGNVGVTFWKETEKRKCNWNVFYPVAKHCCTRCTDLNGRQLKLKTDINGKLCLDTSY